MKDILLSLTSVCRAETAAYSPPPRAAREDEPRVRDDETADQGRIKTESYHETRCFLPLFFFWMRLWFLSGVIHVTKINVRAAKTVYYMKM